MAAGVAGAAAMGSALKRVATAGPLFSTYLNEEVGPVLNAGYLPPVSAGFNEFLGSDRIGALSAQLLVNAEDAEETDPFDTHPCLGDRLAALDAGGNRQPSTASTEPAAALIGDAEAHVRALLEVVAGAEAIRNLTPIEWDAVGPTVYTARWREIVFRKAAWLSRFTADSMPAGTDGFIRAGSDLVAVDEENANRDERVARASQLLAVGLGVLLIDDGWTPRTRPGLPVTFARDSRNVDPFALVDALANGRLTSEAWQVECKALGIAGRPLAREAAPV
jgi:hypothetical protein